MSTGVQREAGIVQRSDRELQRNATILQRGGITAVASADERRGSGQTGDPSAHRTGSALLQRMSAGVQREAGIVQRSDRELQRTATILQRGGIPAVGSADERRGSAQTGDSSAQRTGSALLQRMSAGL